MSAVAECPSAGTVGLRPVYFNEFNVLQGRATYLPLVSGLLHAYALTSEAVKANYTFMPYLFHIDTPAKILASYVQPPAVAAFSVLMWNEQLCLTIAREIKQRYPACVIIFGGASVPHHSKPYMEAHPFIDITVRGEGEEAFTQILEGLLTGADLAEFPGVNWRMPSGEIRCSDKERPFQRELDYYPSPYLEGLFDDLMGSRSDLTFQAIIETNRGCPFHCTFCYWGKGGLSRKYRYHGLDRVFAEIEWMAKKGIQYVFNADSNFGMNKRDRELADFLVDTKKKYGFPEKFRTCYGKNTDERIFEIGMLFKEHQLEKGITISYQSTNPEVQKNIKRDNIKINMARELHRRFNESNVPVYTELILGLPGETAETWINGIDDILSSGLKNQMFVYVCQVYPNTELADPEYQRQFGIVTKRLPANEIHAAIRRSDWVNEFEDVIVATNSMPIADWRQMLVFSWTTMVIHSLKTGFFVLSWLHDRFGLRHSDFLRSLVGTRGDPRFPCISEMIEMFEGKVDRVVGGEGRGCILPDFGSIYWDVEEAAFLGLSKNFDGYCAEMEALVADLLTRRGAEFDPLELKAVMAYQRIRLPTVVPMQQREHQFAFNVTEYFDTYFDHEGRAKLVRKPESVVIDAADYAGDLARYAKESILWGRKSGTLLTPVFRT